jgi:putative iron-dependent peroxidase
MPFGTIGAREYGTYFIGYARTPAVTERMLRNMFLGDRPGIHDRILDFSTATTGCLFYVPTVNFLNDLPEPPSGHAAAEDTHEHRESAGDDSGHQVDRGGQDAGAEDIGQ